MRRELLALALLIFASPASAQPAPATETSAWQPRDGEQLYFDVYRDGGKFGRHVVTFHRSGDELKVDSDIELRVDLGPLNVFHYIHTVAETWDAGRLEQVRSKTRKDGKWMQLAADDTANGLSVVGKAFKGVEPGPVIPSTHWNIAEMRQPAMFSTETGEMLPMKVIDQGIEKVRVGASQIDARRYLVKSQMDVTFWYDAAGRWVKCAFATQGSKVEYVLRG